MGCWEVDMVVCVEASMVRMGNPNGGGPNAADATGKYWSKFRGFVAMERLNHKRLFDKTWIQLIDPP